MAGTYIFLWLRHDNNQQLQTNVNWTVHMEKKHIRKKHLMEYTCTYLERT